MKTEFKSKFLQHMIAKKRNNEGFTLIELLVVIIIIGILAAIALPSFLNQANRARQSEAQNYAGSANRAQQAYRLDNTQFAADISDLGIGIPTQTQFYTYNIGPANASTARFQANEIPGDLLSYSGCVTASGGTTTARIVPETTAGNDAPACP